LKPAGFKLVGNHETFIVDFPIEEKERHFLGCYAHGEGRIQYGHEWDEDCSDRRVIDEFLSKR
jgi:hypothetical protein